MNNVKILHVIVEGRYECMINNEHFDALKSIYSKHGFICEFDTYRERTANFSFEHLNHWGIYLYPNNIRVSYNNDKKPISFNNAITTVIELLGALFCVYPVFYNTIEIECEYSLKVNGPQVVPTALMILEHDFTSRMELSIQTDMDKPIGATECEIMHTANGYIASGTSTDYFADFLAAIWTEI